ncbi:MAG: nuclear transport factor 2 family protein [Woeseiaceae bacterium]
MPMIRIGALIAMLLMFSAASAETQSSQDAEAELQSMLDEFLAGTASAEVHDRFWDDVLVYTSSSGTRFGKSDIMQGFADADDDAAEPSMLFSGEDVFIQVYGDMAVVTFTLVGSPVDAGEAQKYLNTGVFRRQQEEWRVVAWHATKMAAD